MVHPQQMETQMEAPSPTYNPNASPGLDPILGDILFDSSEVPIIRGGWYDRNNFYWSLVLEKLRGNWRGRSYLVHIPAYAPTGLIGAPDGLLLRSISVYGVAWVLLLQLGHA